MNIYRTREIDSTPTSQYRTPTEEFLVEIENQQFTDDVTTILSQQCNEKKLSFQVKQLEMGVVQRTYDMTVSLK